jgi:trigger factor
VNVSVENLGPCKRLLRVEVPVERVNAAFDEVTADFARQAQIQGFRPGKAPKHLILKQYGSSIEQETKKKLFNDSYRAATTQEKLKVVVSLDVEEQQFGRSVPMQYTVTLEVAPEFSLPNYKGLLATRENKTAGDADVDRALNILREQQVKYNDVLRPLNTGDVAVVNYHGTSEGKPLTELAPTARGLAEKQNFWVLVQHDAFIPGFTDPLVGASAGDKRTVTLTLPADFVQKELAGKVVDYAVEVVGVKEKELPTVNDEFAKQFGAENLDALLKGIRSDLQRELDFRAKNAVRDQLLRNLLQQVTCDLPESVLASEANNLANGVANENLQRGVARELIEARRDEIITNAKASAVDRVKASFILNRIAEVEKIQVGRDELGQRLMFLAQQNNTTPDKFVKWAQDNNKMPEIHQEILTGKVLDLVETAAQISETTAAATAPATT